MNENLKRALQKLNLYAADLIDISHKLSKEDVKGEVLQAALMVRDHAMQIAEIGFLVDRLIEKEQEKGE